MAPPSSTKNIQLPNSQLWLGELTSTYESNNLTSPPTGSTFMSHDAWIRELTTSLLKSGAVKNEILLKIEPMFKFKVT